MKVIFSAFGKKLTSAVIELPENTIDRFRLPLDMDALLPSAKMDGSMVPDSPLHKIGTFQWTGNYLHYPGQNESARDYVLVDIS
ncbi:MAG: hypothetical protein PSV22_16180 [Pseudolabrys sp.]|nr:hypothetical protein [Pseudolabrys sp.]